MKKLLLGSLAVVVLLTGSVAPSDAGGRHRGGWHGGWKGGWRGPAVFVGPRFVVAPPVFYYQRPYVYAPAVVLAAPPVVAAPPPPTVYTESAQYWYYCHNPSGYYPSVPECPSGWLQVAPQPQ